MQFTKFLPPGSHCPFLRHFFYLAAKKRNKPPLYEKSVA